MIKMGILISLNGIMVKIPNKISYVQIFCISVYKLERLGRQLVIKT